MIESIYNDFTNFLDSIYYEGYAEQLAGENPEQFTFEFNEYLENYNLKKNLTRWNKKRA
jgi:hypothetical protein